MKQSATAAAKRADNFHRLALQNPHFAETPVDHLREPLGWIRLKTQYRTREPLTYA